MGKISGIITGLKAFVGEVRQELAKCSWPTRPELMESTVVVIVSCLILAAFVGISDVVMMNLMSIIIR